MLWNTCTTQQQLYFCEQGDNQPGKVSESKIVTILVVYFYVSMFEKWNKMPNCCIRFTLVEHWQVFTYTGYQGYGLYWVQQIKYCRKPMVAFKLLPGEQYLW